MAAEVASTFEVWVLHLQRIGFLQPVFTIASRTRAAKSQVFREKGALAMTTATSPEKKVCFLLLLLVFILIISM